MSNKKLISLSGLFMLASSFNSYAQSEELMAKPMAEKEKCYGIVKASKNDCAASDGSHSCAGYAKKDNDGREWVLLPKGTCERIVGGLTTPSTDEQKKPQTAL